MDQMDMRIADLAREFLMVALVIAGPMLIVGLVVGLTVSLFQTLTSVQEQTLTQIPKMLAVFFVTLLLLAPILAILKDYTASIFAQLVEFGLS
ncbi:MAG: flagellar biosynthetic protein FliQ [Planctomycetota bacterium]|nr:MAG: flagellar biosynthetic protein FliQ [Planctomycetota bacterium]